MIGPGAALFVFWTSDSNHAPVKLGHVTQKMHPKHTTGVFFYVLLMCFWRWEMSTKDAAYRTFKNTPYPQCIGVNSLIDFKDTCFFYIFPFSFYPENT